jgi:hypothetical protein
VRGKITIESLYPQTDPPHPHWVINSRVGPKITQWVVAPWVSLIPIELLHPGWASSLLRHYTWVRPQITIESLHPTVSCHIPIESLHPEWATSTLSQYNLSDPLPHWVIAPWVSHIPIETLHHEWATPHWVIAPHSEPTHPWVIAPWVSHILIESLHPKWATTFPVSHYTLSEPLPHSFITSRGSHHIPIESLQPEWATKSPLSHCTLSEPRPIESLHREWATAWPLRNHMFKNILANIPCCSCSPSGIGQM